MGWLLDGQPMRRILVSRLRYLGDVIMSTVVLDVLRRGDPDVYLGYLCESGHGAALADHPQLDRLHLLGSRRRGADARARVAEAPDGGTVNGFWGTVADLRAARYDLAVDLFFNPRSAWLLRLGGMTRRIGGTPGSRRHLYSHIARPEDLPAGAGEGTPLSQGGLGHHLSRLAPLVHAETGLSFTAWLKQAGPATVCPRIAGGDPAPATAAALAQAGLATDRPYAVLAPGATWPSKEWPEDRWVELARLLGREQGLPLAVLVPPGREGDWPALAQAVNETGGGVLPPLPLDQALAVLGRSGFLVSVDGGIMHAGVGLAVPTVGVFGPTSPEAWFPYAATGPYRVVALRPDCHPCDRHACDAFICLPDLAAGPVARAVAEVLAP